MADTVVVEYAWQWVDPHPNDGPIALSWDISIMNRWPNNDPTAGGEGPWGVTRLNRKPVKVVKRTVTYSDWEDCPNPEPPYGQTGDPT
jgi:hypothetical protein